MIYLTHFVLQITNIMECTKYPLAGHSQTTRVVSQICETPRKYWANMRPARPWDRHSRIPEDGSNTVSLTARWATLSPILLWWCRLHVRSVFHSRDVVCISNKPHPSHGRSASNIRNFLLHSFPLLFMIQAMELCFKFHIFQLPFLSSLNISIFKAKSSFFSFQTWCT